MSGKPWFKRFVEWRRRQSWWPTKMITERRSDEPFLERTSLIKIPGLFQIAIHRFWQSDDDGGLHDHPWAFWGSYILEGGYKEHTPQGVFERKPGDLRWRTGWEQHRIELPYEGAEVWTLFIMGPKIRIWGFIPHGSETWIPWKRYLELRAAEGKAARAQNNRAPEKARAA